MKKLMLIAALVATFGGPVIAQQQNTVIVQSNGSLLPYCALLLPDSLKKNAHAVLREDHTVFRMEDMDISYETRHYVVTVLDAQGDEYARLVEWYTPNMREVRNIKGILYDALGVQVRKLKSADIQDISAVDNMTFMTDTRYKMYEFAHGAYPYTVEFEYEIKKYDTYTFPHWAPQEDEDVTVQQSSFTVIVPENYPLRYYNQRVGKPKESTPEKGMHQYDWEMKNVPAVHHESLSQYWRKRCPMVITAPGDFEMKKYKGNMSTWENLGKFSLQLNEGRDVLPEAVAQKAHQLTDNLASADEKIAALYTYLQQNTRYVGVQLGIGGIQTFDAEYVSKKGYGDCKALANYMYSLLKAVGISSCQVWIHAGDAQTDFLDNFPSDQFNHVILMVPKAKDTTWLECTSQTLSPGYLSAFTADRSGLAFTDKGGVLVHTPVYTMEDNKELRKVDVKIEDDGKAIINCFTHSSGEEQDDLHQQNHNTSQENILKKLREAFNFPSYDVSNYDWKEFPGKIPAIDETMQLSVNAYAQVTGKRLFLQTNVLNRSGLRLSKDSVRVGEIQLHDAYINVDTTVFTLPAGYTPESLPKTADLHSAFGDYHASVAIKDNVVTYVREYKQHAGIYPASNYAAAVDFFDGIYKADHAKAVFVKQQ